MSGWAEVASLIAAEVVRFEHTLECHPLQTREQVISLISGLSWSVFIGIFPDHDTAAATSMAISRETGRELQASELVYCGAGAGVIAIRRCEARAQAKAQHLAGSVRGMLRQLAVQLAYQEIGSQQAQLGRITQE